MKRTSIRKYRNKKIKVGDITFDSKKEYKRYEELRILEFSKRIKDLELQPTYQIKINDQLICKYVGDFRYKEGNKTIVEDVKSEITRKNPVYRLKKKLMKAVYGIDVKET